MEEAKFTYSLLGKAFEKQRKTIEYQGIKQVEALKALKSEGSQKLDLNEVLFPKKIRTIAIKNEMDYI